MAALLIVITLLALYHYVYESAIAPSARLQLRYKLFKIRDELRTIKSEGNIDDKDFKHLDLIVSKSICMMPGLSPITLYEVNRLYDRDENLKTKTDEFVRSLKHSNDENVKRIFSNVFKINARALVINFGGWFPYILPLIMILIFYSTIKVMANRIVMTPSNKIAALNNLQGFATI